MEASGGAFPTGETVSKTEVSMWLTLVGHFFDQLKFILLVLSYWSQETHSRFHAKLLHSCPTVCDPVDCRPSGSSSMGFSRQEYWSGLPFHPPGHLPDPGTEPASLMSPALAGRFFFTTCAVLFILDTKYINKNIRNLKINYLKYTRQIIDITANNYSQICVSSRLYSYDYARGVISYCAWSQAWNHIEQLFLRFPSVKMKFYVLEMNSNIRLNGSFWESLYKCHNITTLHSQVQPFRFLYLS